MTTISEASTTVAGTATEAAVAPTSVAAVYFPSPSCRFSVTRPMRVKPAALMFQRCPETGRRLEVKPEGGFEEVFRKNRERG